LERTVKNFDADFCVIYYLIAEILTSFFELYEEYKHNLDKKTREVCSCFIIKRRDRISLNYIQEIVERYDFVALSAEE